MKQHDDSIYDSKHRSCEWYVDMGEHNKPLCKRKGYRPANCDECPTYIESIKTENAKLRELVSELYGSLLFSCNECWFHGDVKTCDNNNCGNHKVYQKMIELGIEVDA